MIVCYNEIKAVRYAADQARRCAAGLIDHNVLSILLIGGYMTLTDIIALAKQGYKPSDIKELIALAESDAPEETNEETVETEDNETEDQENKETDEKESETDPEELKKLLDQFKSENEKLKKDLKTAQKLNQTHDTSNEDNRETDEDIFNKAFQNLL